MAGESGGYGMGTVRTYVCRYMYVLYLKRGVHVGRYMCMVV